VDLIVQPSDGLSPLLKAIHDAKSAIDVTIFRLDRPEIVKALGAAVSRGVAVRALIAHTNSSGEKALRKLELRLLQAGVTVARTADDLPRYHGKLMTIDRDRLYLLGFNYTRSDIVRSRSFGLIVEDDDVVREAIRLFEADLLKQDYTPKHDSLVVSPENARERLSQFIKGATRQLLIYDGRLSDRAMQRLLLDRVKSGVEVRVLGRCSKDVRGRIPCASMPRYRLHIRAIVRDSEQAFVGSQSLRRAELDERREVGMLLAHRPTVRRIQQVFEEDWAVSDLAKEAREEKEARAAAG
jgi:phosphatidylserine/phosphatidylglycerophosphate/cardiolipin synthase-like enzyme